MTEIFERDAPYYISIGMTRDEYWYGDPHAIKDYYEAFKLYKRRVNDEAWLYGAYVCKALNATVGNMFRKKGTQPETYPDKPIEFEQDKQSRAAEIDEEQQATWAKAYMMQMVMVGKNWGKH